jgi:hypothetical protein
VADISPGIAGQQQQPGPCLPAGVADISPGIAGQQQQPGARLPAGVADISPGIAGQQQQPGPCLPAVVAFKQEEIYSFQHQQHQIRYRWQPTTTKRKADIS